MKLTIALALLTSFAAHASSGLPADINALVGKTGEFTSLYNGKTFEAENGGACSIEESEYGEGVVVIEAATHFKPSADLEGATKATSNGVTTYTTNSNGKRPGGSVCGDFSPLTSYKKTVIVTKNSLTIKQKYTCAIFDRNEIVETCTIK